MEKAGLDDADFDTMCMFQDVLDEKNPLFEPDEAVNDEMQAMLRKMTEKRCGGYPLQYILGTWEFYGYPFRVGEGVLIPRPDTETLIEQVIAICREKGMTSPKIADLCSGSGCIAITLKKEIPGADVTAVELSKEALGYLRENVRLNSADVNIIEGDVLKKDTVRMLKGLDIIVSNPPYLTAQDMRELQSEVRCEPVLALFGGNDGLGFYRAITELWRPALKTGGFIAYEFGMGQHEQVTEILRQDGFNDIRLKKDLGGIIRTAAAFKPEEWTANRPRYTDHTID